MPRTNRELELAVRCPRCKAEAGENCRSLIKGEERGEKLIQWVHPARCRELARQQQGRGAVGRC